MAQIDYRFTTSIPAQRGITTTPKGMLTQAVVNANYPSGNSLNGLVQLKGEGWQKFIVPKSTSYYFEVVGAPGADWSYSNSSLYTEGGKGAKISGFVNLKAGDVLYILVGQQGWFQVPPNDYASGAGGASAILRANPDGAFTFAPDSIKVEALVVSGGGGSPGDNSYPHNPGGNAVLTNGTNTNAGVTYATASGGAGLTGQTSGAWKIPPPLLSGNGGVAGEKNGGFGGGGAGYDAGAGGGGYSGGDGGKAVNGQAGGKGGTSFVNATYIQNEVRELDTFGVKHGYVLLRGGRNPEKKILALDSEGYKYFDETSWVLVNPSDPLAEPSIADYDTYGDKDITNVDGLNDTTKFLSKSDADSEVLDIAGLLHRQVIKPNFDVDISNVETIRQIVATTTGTGATVKFAVSTDHGLTYQTISNGVWMSIDINDKTDFANNGIPLSDFNTTPATVWNSLRAKNIRFAMIFEATSETNNFIVSQIALTVDYLGSWRRATVGTDYIYEYPTNDILRVTILTNQEGVKISYLDQKA